MAIAAFDLVAPRLVWTAAVDPQGPIFGVVEAVAGTATVLWYRNGSRVATIATTTLDKIGTDTTQASMLVGRRVKVTDPSGQTNSGLAVCIAVYTRQTDGAGTVTTYALLRRDDGSCLEVLASVCEVAA